MSIFYKETDNPKILGIAAACKAKVWKEAVPAFDLIQEQPKRILIESQQYSKEIEYLKNEFPEIDVVVFKDSYFVTSEQFKVIDLNSIPHMASETMFGGGEYDEKFATDISVFTENLDESFVTWIEKLFSCSNFKVKMYGAKMIKSPIYLGSLSNEEYKTVMASSIMNLVFDEKWGMNCLLNGCCPIFYKINNGFTNASTMIKQCEEEALRLIGNNCELPKPKTYEEYVRKENLC